jgi:hypothetical protein
LKDISEKYLVISFTASHQSNADSILDTLDPNKELIKYRLYRHHCIKRAIINEEEQEENNKIPTEFAYVKDLRIIKNIDIKNTILIDNSVLSFAFQIDNGVPILPFYDNKEDNELLFLKNYLERISDATNLLDVNIKTIKLGIMYKPFKQNNVNINNEEEDNNLNISKSFDTEDSIPTRKIYVDTDKSPFCSNNLIFHITNSPEKKEKIKRQPLIDLIKINQSNNDSSPSVKMRNSVESINSSIHDDNNSFSIKNNSKNSFFKNSKITSIIDLKLINEQSNSESSDRYEYISKIKEENKIQEESSKETNIIYSGQISENLDKSKDENKIRGGPKKRSSFQRQLFSSMKDLKYTFNK